MMWHVSLKLIELNPSLHALNVCTQSLPCSSDQDMKIGGRARTEDGAW